MLSIIRAVCIGMALMVALWWALWPPRFPPRPLPRIDSDKAEQCPPGSRRDGTPCVCTGTWTESACTARAATRQARARSLASHEPVC
jgi:hypothetical protein